MEENKQETDDGYDDYDNYGFCFDETNDGYSDNGLPIMDLDFGF